MDPGVSAFDCGGCIRDRWEPTNAILSGFSIVTRPKGNRARVDSADFFDTRGSGRVLCLIFGQRAMSEYGVYESEFMCLFNLI